MLSFYKTSIDSEVRESKLIINKAIKHEKSNNVRFAYTGGTASGTVKPSVVVIPPKVSDRLARIDLNLVAAIAKQEGIVPHHLAGILKFENGGGHRQSLINLWKVYPEAKANIISRWCKKQKKDLVFPEWVKCDQELSFGQSQINLWVHREVSVEQALNQEFAIRWTAKYLVYKGYQTNKKLAIRKYNGFSTTEANRKYADAVLQVARRIVF